MQKEVIMATVAIKTNPVNWFEIPVKDLARAQNFYEKVLGRKLTREDMDTLKMAFPPRNRAFLEQRAPLSGGNPMSRHMQERSCISPLMISKKHLRRINANGGKPLLPKKNIGDYGFIAHFEDTEGNRLALHSMK